MLNQLGALLRDAGRQLLLPRLHRVTRDYKADGSVVTEADLALQDHLLQALDTRWPGISLLSEEMPEAQRRRALDNATQGVWALDPLDGTTNFASGIPYFCISLALIRHGELELGVVYDPNRDELFTAERDGGAALNGEPLRLTPLDLPLRKAAAIVDLKRLPSAMATRLATAPPYCSQRSFGSVALDWCWLAAGRGQLYLHGSMNLWDYAAGLLVFQESGGHASTLDGEAVFLPRLEKRSAVAAVERRLFDAWRRGLAAPDQDA